MTSVNLISVTPEAEKMMVRSEGEQPSEPGEPEGLWTP